MTRGLRRLLLFAAVLMAVGTLLPWARTQRPSDAAEVVVGAIGNGGRVVLALAVVLAVTAFARWSWTAVLVSGAAAMFVADLAYSLPGELLAAGGAWKAGIGIGLELALLGVVLAGCASAGIVYRALRHGPPWSTAGRG